MSTVTVIIPTYNRADVLPRAIESVLAQTYEEFELLVVDDGSTDRTPEVLSSFDDGRLRVESHETNRGANAARNTGIDEADGKYVAFLDSDDTWYPEKLERQLGRLERADEDCVAVYCDSERASTDQTDRLRSTAATFLERFDDESAREGGDELAAEILADRLQSGAGSTLLVETDVARRIDGFDEDLNRFQDPEFLLRIVHEGGLSYVDEALVTRYDTGAPSPETIEQANKYLLEKHHALVADLEADGHQIQATHALLLAKAYLRDGQFGAGLTYLSRAAVPGRHWPGVLWSTGTGIRKRATTRGLVAAGFVLLMVAVLVRRR